MRIPATAIAAIHPAASRSLGWWGRLSALSFGVGGVIGIGLALALANPESAEGAAMERPSPAKQQFTAASGRAVFSGQGKKALARLQPDTIEAALTKARPFKYWGPRTDRERAAQCLAAAAWYEIGDDRTGQRAVVQTVINRVNHPGFPNSVCGVVFEGSQRSTGCQFTFTCDGSLSRRRPSARAWERALSVANDALDGFVDASIGSATHYHADYVTPWWSAHLKRLTAVGPHVFYRWSGNRGTLRAPGRLDAELDYQTLVKRSTEGRAEISAETGTGENAQMTRVEAANIAAGSAIPSATIAPAKPVGKAIFLQVNDQQPSGRWAISALNACAGRKDCQVIAYDSAGAVGANKSRSPGQFDRPRFLFLRDAKSGMDIALWDCERAPRPSPSQCLPSDGPALKSLLRER